ncbi:MULTISPECIES: hypothetical protein [Moorena]|nr:hypothetical protein [Moorena sp. SIO4G3]
MIQTAKKFYTFEEYLSYHDDQKVGFQAPSFVGLWPRYANDGF